MTHNVHHTQSVNPKDLETKLRWENFKLLISINLLKIDDPIDASKKFRNCFLKLNESPTPPSDCFSKLSETPTENDEEFIERCKLEAKQVYDILIQMGERSTRSIRCNFHWKTVLFGEEQFYQDTEKNEKLFYYGIIKPRRALHLMKADVIVSHWAAKKKRLDEKLQWWQDFLDIQQWRRDHRPEFAKNENMERQRYSHDPQFTANLKKLTDWKEYQVYFQRGIDRLKRGMKKDRRAVEAIQRNGPEMNWNTELRKFRGSSHENWLNNIEKWREKLAAEKKRLEWVKKQFPMILSKCVILLMKLSISRRQMEEKSELEVKQVYNILMDMGGRPRRPILLIFNIHNVEHTNEHFHVVCYWENECNQFEKELKEWKKFLDYRQKKNGWENENATEKTTICKEPDPNKYLKKLSSISIFEDR